MIVILSIKMKYVRTILNGNKKYEFRKTSFKRKVEEVFVYSPKPVGKIVCKFYVGEIIMDKPENLWMNFKDFSGLSKEEFFTYFYGKEKGVAIEIKDVEKFIEPIEPKKIYPKFIPPQLWIYVSSIEPPLN
jgi:type I restriction enzyme S subunit